MSIAEGVDRRRYARQRVSSLAYVELGKDNGGIVLNVSEGGLGVAAATPMMGESLPRVRFRLPGSSVWIEASAKIAWIAESRKEAGIIFLDLPEVDRTRIRLWLLSPEPAPAASPRSRPLGPRLVPSTPKAASQASRLPLEQQDEVQALDNAEVEAEAEAEAEAGGEIISYVNSEVCAVSHAEVVQAVKADPQAQPLASGPLAEVPPVSEKASAEKVAAAERLAAQMLAAERIAADKVAAAERLAAEKLTAERVAAEKAAAAEKFAAEKLTAERVAAEKLAAAERAAAAEKAAAERSAAAERTAAAVSLAAQKASHDPAPAPARPLVPSLFAPTAASEADAARELPFAARQIEEPAGGGRPLAEHWVNPEPRPSRWLLVSTLALTIAALAFLLGITVGRHSWDSLLVKFSNPRSTAGDSSTLTASSSPATNALQEPAPAPASAAPNLKAQNLPLDNPPSVNSQAPPTPAASAQEANGTIAEPSAGLAPAPVRRQPFPGDAAAAPTSPSSAEPRESVPQSPAAAASRTTEPVTPPAAVPARPSSGSVYTAPPAQGVYPSPGQPSGQPSAQPPGPAAAQQRSQPPVSAAAVSPEAPVAPSAAAPAPTPEITVIPPPTPTGTVEVLADPYPSIRVPPELRNSRAGMALQLGQLTTRINPTYPQQALREGVQGIVQLHILIGTDGTVMEMEVVRGPQMLIQPARDAIGRWRYQPTYLGNRAIETEADVTITFRLTTPAR